MTAVSDTKNYVGFNTICVPQCFHLAPLLLLLHRKRSRTCEEISLRIDTVQEAYCMLYSHQQQDKEDPATATPHKEE